MASPELSSLLSHIFSVVWWVGAKENDLRERLQVRESRVSNLTSYRTASHAQCKSKGKTCASDCNRVVSIAPRVLGGYSIAPRVLRRCRADRSRSGVVSVWVE